MSDVPLSPRIPITASLTETATPAVAHDATATGSDVRHAEQHIIEEITEVTSRYSGPVPPPDMLSQYNNSFPGCAEVLVEMARAEAAHRHEMERMRHQIELEAQACENNLAKERMVVHTKWVDGKLRSERRGQLSALVITLAIIGAGFFLLFNDKDAAGLAVILGAAVSLVGLFVYAQRIKNQTTHVADSAQSDDQESPRS